ncbi:MAG: hypothetical protein ABIH69_01385 [bacterium]|nr:hypothetical protein [Candidatus Margulisiibacteriota bacterium]
MIDTQLPKRKNPRLKNFNYSSFRAYFITVCSLNKRRIFTNAGFNSEIIKLLFEEKRRLNFLVYVKSKATHLAWTYGMDGKIWQGRFHDHVVREKEGLSKVGEYILNNPVRKELSDSWQNYRFCGVIDAWN